MMAGHKGTLNGESPVELKLSLPVRSAQPKMSSAATTKALGEPSSCGASESAFNDEMGGAEVSTGFVTGLFGLYCWEVVITSWHCEVSSPSL